ncbi:flavin-containing monooxygenase [Phytoactinopolyspora limicola]|uniref:flavin-containing monooxygenase n=1 Tax=Phytoactinopolyspora limicola TaxID=2715536 RepID=UPI001A9C6FA8|nr:NAD(P)/FAD-dependent oxidoreductase [Phytoactinopolyspora limicola]
MTHVHVAIIGAGFSGLCMAIRLRDHGMEDFIVLERAGDIGGAWHDNTYPGCACDVPSALYSFSFAPRPHWTSTFPTQREVADYLHRCADTYGVRPHLRLRHEVLFAKWREEEAYWEITTARETYTANVLIAATGPLSEPASPSIPGLERFAGDVFHSAAWDHTLNLADRRVAVIGTGASATQFIPEIQPIVSRLYVFQRTPPWVMPRLDRRRADWERRLYRRFPVLQRVVRTTIFWARESLVAGLTVNRRLLKPAEWLARLHLHSQVRDPGLRAALTPDYTIGCKRLILSNRYLPAITQANTELVTDAIWAVTPDGIVTEDGAHRLINVIIHATGFEAAHMPIAHRLHGRTSSLAERWNGSAEAYLGTAVAGFPNLFLLLGPNTVSGQNSSLLTMEAQVNYVVDALRFMSRFRVATLDVRRDTQSSFVADVQARMKGTVWLSGCHSWYLDERGRNTTLWPGLTGTFRRRVRRFDPGDYLLRLAPHDADGADLTGKDLI